MINKNCSSLIDQTLNESSVPAFRCEGWGRGLLFLWIGQKIGSVIRERHGEKIRR